MVSLIVLVLMLPMKRIVHLYVLRHLIPARPSFLVTRSNASTKISFAMAIVTALAAKMKQTVPSVPPMLTSSANLQNVAWLLLLAVMAGMIVATNRMKLIALLNNVLFILILCTLVKNQTLASGSAKFAILPPCVLNLLPKISSTALVVKPSLVTSKTPFLYIV